MIESILAYLAAAGGVLLLVYAASRIHDKIDDWRRARRDANALRLRGHSEGSLYTDSRRVVIYAGDDSVSLSIPLAQHFARLILKGTPDATPPQDLPAPPSPSDNRP